MAHESFRTGGAEEGAPPASPATLYAAILPQCMDFATMKKQYPFIGTLKSLLGAAPNTLRPMQLFRGAFSFPAVGVPAFLNLPFCLFGLGADFTCIMVASFASSESSGCKYCILHG